MQRCRACSKFRWHPAPRCTHCGGADYDWAPLSGRGRVTTWTLITHPVHPAAVARVPYVVAEIELAEQPGLRMISNIVDAAPEAIAFDAPVTVGFVTHPQGQKLPVFRLEPGGA
jgi:uncharacterized OB-fold protein